MGEATSIEWQLAAAANSDFYDFRQFQAYAEGGGRFFASCGEFRQMTLKFKLAIDVITIMHRRFHRR